ncbi:hypothetical protein [Ralstonia sp. 1138]|uniref:hypothetical protein n=1 Tax=Ralstonia sp. 1138 TaxID=3156423 RepID=UPI00339B507E
MGYYDDLLKTKGSGTPFDKLVPISVVGDPYVKLSASKAPRDFIEFLVEIGSGELGNAAYMLYDGLVEPGEIYGYVPAGLENVLLFGDDFQGFNAGFSGGDWSVVEIDPTNMQVNTVAKNFYTFIRGKIADLS